MSVYNVHIIYQSKIKNSADRFLQKLNYAVTVKFEDANKKELDFSFIKLKEQLQSYFMKSVQHERIKILMTEMLTKARVHVLNKRISLNQCVMIKKNLNDDVMIRNSLNQCEILEKISNLCNVTADTSSDLHMKQKTDLNSSDQSVLTENFYTDLSRKIKKKDLNLTEFIQENF